MTIQWKITRNYPWKYKRWKRKWVSDNYGSPTVQITSTNQSTQKRIKDHDDNLKSNKKNFFLNNILEIENKTLETKIWKHNSKIN